MLALLRSSCSLKPYASLALVRVSSGPVCISVWYYLLSLDLARTLGSRLVCLDESSVVH